MTTFPASRTAHLPCDHRMCNTCLKRQFDLSLTDPQHMPPKCCTSKPIPLKHVDKLYDSKFKRRWNAKQVEFSTKNRIYCPARRCGTWIKPSETKTDSKGRKYGKCSRCKLKVCCTCNGKWHVSKSCPKDPETQEFIKFAKEKGWQRCYNCSATVELKEGCNHMTCRCTAEFCMICGAKWKTCDCPWFNYQAVEADRLNHMNVPFVRQVPVGNPGLGFQQEMDLRRAQERRDAALARRMQMLAFGDDEDGPEVVHQGFGNAADHFMNDNFVRRARDILAGQVNVAQNEAAERLIAEHRRGHERHQAQQARHREPPPFPIFLNRPTQQRPQANPQAPVPPRNPATPLRRANTTANANERVIPRRSPERNYQADAERYRPIPPPAPAPPDQSTRTHTVGGDWNPHVNPARASQLAGIARGRTAAGRVDEWRQWVDAVS